MPLRLVRTSAVLALFGWLGCAGANSTTDDARLVVQLPLELATGQRTDLARLRGRPALLFMLATYDTASQLALVPLSELQAKRPELQLLGIALQPDAEKFLPLYANALDVQFPLAFDPSGNLLRGTTSLGEIPAVPCYLLLDAEGVVQARYVGVMELDALDDFVKPVLR
jgi:hypothetical protein